MIWTLKMSATRLQHGPNFLTLCICWQVWAPLALSNKLDSGYFPDCLLRKVLPHPRVFCSWLRLMGKLLRIIVLQKDSSQPLLSPPYCTQCMCLLCACVCGWKKGAQKGRKGYYFRLCVAVFVQHVFPSGAAVLLEHWKARPDLFLMREVRIFGLDSSGNPFLPLLWSIHYIRRH